MERIPRRIIVAYSMGSIGTGIYLTVPSVLLLYYLTQILLIPPGLAGLAVFLPRVWDMITDPFMGWISDRTRSPLGRRRPYLLAGGILTSLTFGMLFSAPELADPMWSFAYVVGIYILSATTYTIYAVPYLSMPAEMSADGLERSRIMSYRMTFAMLGVLAGSALAPALLEYFGGGRAGFAAMSWVISSICAATMLLAFFGTAKSPDVSVGTLQGQPAGRFSDLRHDRSFVALGGTYLFQLAGFGVFVGTIPYFVTHIANQSEGAISEMFIALLGGTIASMFIWNLIAGRTGKARAYCLSGLTAAIGFAGLWLAAADASWETVLLMTLVIGIGFGGLQLLPFALLTDVIHAARVNGHDAAGTYTGVWTAVEKGGLALGPLIVGTSLSLGGFLPSASVQSDQTIKVIAAVLTLVPAAFVLASIPIAFLCANRLKKAARQLESSSRDAEALSRANVLAKPAPTRSGDWMAPP